MSADDIDVKLFVADPYLNHWVLYRPQHCFHYFTHVASVHDDWGGATRLDYIGVSFYMGSIHPCQLRLLDVRREHYVLTESPLRRLEDIEKLKMMLWQD